MQFQIHVLFLIVVFGLPKAAPAAANHCEKGWMSYERRCYFFSTDQLVFKEAMLKCLEKGAELLELDDGIEEDWIDLQSRVRGYNQGVWLGVNDIQQENHFVTLSNGRIPHFIHWAKGEPNNIAGGEHCALYWVATKGWHDGACTRTANYVCKK